MSQVIRLQISEQCLVTDGQGTEVVAEIKTYRADGRAELAVVEKTESSLSLSGPRIRIFQAIPKQAKFDFLVQKAQELGAWELKPVISEFTVVRIDAAKKAETKLERWNKIAIEAAKQSGALQVLRLTAPESLAQSIQVIETGESMVIFHPERNKPFAEWIESLQKDALPAVLNVFIGPEGGFSDNEIESLLEYSRDKSCVCDIVGLGETVLKVDTAFVGGLAALQLFCRDKR